MTKQEKINLPFDDLEDVHVQILDESSDATLSAVEHYDEEQAEQSTETDADGITFDPELHATDREGKPSLTPLGKFRKKRGASKVATKSDAVKKAQDENAARAAGVLAADMMIIGCVNLLGPEWAPIGKEGEQAPVEFNEHDNLRRAFGDYFVARNISDFPPGIALTMALSSYAIPRFVGGKETKTRLAKVKIWFADKWNSVRRKRKDAAQSSSGDDRKREKYTSEKDVSTKPESTKRDAGT